MFLPPQALAAALYICGWKEEAIGLMSRFKWGHSFFRTNEELLERYAACKTAPEVIEASPHTRSYRSRVGEEGRRVLIIIACGIVRVVNQYFFLAYFLLS